MTSTSKGKGLWRARCVARLSMLLGLVLAGPAEALPPTAPAPGAYTANGPVQAVAHVGGRTYIGGAFTRVGTRSGSGVVLSPTGAAGSFPEVAGGDVHAAVSDGVGGWYVGGTFTAVGGAPRVGLAHVMSDGSVDPGFNVSVTDSGGIPAPVYALALSPPRPDGDRVLYVGGEFTRIGTGPSLQGRRNLAALRASNGSVNGSFATITTCDFPPACQGAVRSLALAHVPVNGRAPQPVLFVGGDFTDVETPQSPKVRTSLAAVWGVGATDPTTIPLDGEIIEWVPPSAAESGETTEPGRIPLSIRTMQVSDPVTAPCASFTCSFVVVYVGGWRSTGTGSGSPTTAAFQFKLTQNSIESIAAARFTNWRPAPSWVPEPAGSPPCVSCTAHSMLLLGATVYFGGEFNKVATPQVDARYLAKIPAITNPTNPLFTPAQPASQLGAGSDGPVRALAASPTSSTTFLAGGDFSGHVAAFSTASEAPDPAWTPPAPDSPVRVLATDASSPSVYAGGEFRALGAVERHGLAAFDASGALLDWAPDVRGGAGAEPRVHALAASGATVYVGGQFDSAPGEGGAGLAAVDAASGSLAAPLPDVKMIPETGVESSQGQPDVLSLSLAGSTLYVGGAFNRIGAAARANLAALDTGTGAVKADWDPGVDKAGDRPAVRAILPACGAVYVGGWFASAGGQARENLAALDPGTGAATSWDPRPNGAVLALAGRGPTIYAGGTFSHIAGAFRRRLGAVRASDGQATAFDANIDGQALGSSVRALAAGESALYVGGHFADLAGNPRSHLAAVDPTTGQTLEWAPAMGRPDVDTRVDALALGNDTLYAGGTFGNVGSTAQRGFAGFGTGAGSPLDGGACLQSTDSLESNETAPAYPPLAPTPGPAPVPRPRSRPEAPVLSAVLVRPAKVDGRRSLRLTFRLSRAARVRLRFTRRVRGRYASFASMTVRGRRGVNRVSFRALRVGRRRLVPGRYRLRLAPLPAASARIPAARARTVYFRVRAGSR